MLGSTTSTTMAFNLAYIMPASYLFHLSFLLAILTIAAVRRPPHSFLGVDSEPYRRKCRPELAGVELRAVRTLLALVLMVTGHNVR